MSCNIQWIIGFNFSENKVYVTGLVEAKGVLGVAGVKESDVRFIQPSLAPTAGAQGVQCMVEAMKLSLENGALFV